MMTALPSIEAVFDALGVDLSDGKRYGDELRIPCLFHQPDNRPSFDINVEKRTYLCRSCGASGGVLDLVVAVGKAADRRGAAAWLQSQALMPAREADWRLPSTNGRRLLPGSGDISWKRDGPQIVEELRRLNESLTSGQKEQPTATVEEGAVETWPFRTQAQIKVDGTPPIEYDIEPLVARHSGPAILFGDSGALKTWQAIEECRCMATGEPLFGKFPVRQRPHAVYVNIDADPYSFDRRVSMLAESIPNFIVYNVETFTLDHFESVLRSYPGSWVVLDCFTDAFLPDPHIDQGLAMRRFIKTLRALYAKHDCNGTLVDHSRRHKPGDPASTDRFSGSQ